MTGCPDVKNPREYVQLVWFPRKAAVSPNESEQECCAKWNLVTIKEQILSSTIYTAFLFTAKETLVQWNKLLILWCCYICSYFPFAVTWRCLGFIVWTGEDSIIKSQQRWVLIMGLFSWCIILCMLVAGCLTLCATKKVSDPIAVHMSLFFSFFCVIFHVVFGYPDLNVV